MMSTMPEETSAAQARLASAIANKQARIQSQNRKKIEKLVSLNPSLATLRAAVEAAEACARSGDVLAFNAFMRANANDLFIALDPGRGFMDLAARMRSANTASLTEADNDIAAIRAQIEAEKKARSEADAKHAADVAAARRMRELLAMDIDEE